MGTGVDSLTSLGGGRNGRVYMVKAGERRWAAKWYFRGADGGRDRLNAEFGAFRFLDQNGETRVPKPVVADVEMGWAVYEFIEGEKILPTEVTDANIDEMAAFLIRLRRLAGVDGARALPLAADACLSTDAILTIVDRRLARLRRVASDEAQHRSMHEFLEQEYKPALESILRRTRPVIDLQRELSSVERTLSPSDFGLHNAVRRVDGRLVFLDFEYFGWDDPAKMICDFLLHPAMSLSDTHKGRFVTRVCHGIDRSESLAARLPIVYPLLAMVWCLILLNEFVPEDLLRRTFADTRSTDRVNLQLAQLGKARRMLAIAQDPKSFHYLEWSA